MNHFARLLILATTVQLGACAALSGKHDAFVVYAPQLHMEANKESSGPLEWQLLVDTPHASAALDTTRIAIMSSPGVLEVYPAARWRDPAPVMLRSLIVQAFDEDARISGVSALDSGLNGDYSLSIEVRDFQAELVNGSAQVAIRLTAKLFDRRSNRIVASQSFEEVAPAASSEVASAAEAFTVALDQLMPKLVDWTIKTGDAQAHATRKEEVKPGGDG
jgi:cholesterol transport system auxiliary component